MGVGERFRDITVDRLNMFGDYVLRKAPTRRSRYFEVVSRDLAEESAHVALQEKIGYEALNQSFAFAGYVMQPSGDEVVVTKTAAIEKMWTGVTALGPVYEGRLPRDSVGDYFSSAAPTDELSMVTFAAAIEDLEFHLRDAEVQVEGVQIPTTIQEKLFNFGKALGDKQYDYQDAGLVPFNGFFEMDGKTLSPEVAQSLINVGYMYQTHLRNLRVM